MVPEEAAEALVGQRYIGLKPPGVDGILRPLETPLDASQGICQVSLAGLLTGVMLNISGFDVALATAQPEKTLLLLRVFDVGVPLASSAIAIWIMSTYEITESRAHEIRAELERRRAAPG